MVSLLLVFVALGDVEVDVEVAFVCPELVCDPKPVAPGTLPVNVALCDV